VARPPKHPVDVKLKIVLSVLRGESTQAEAARRHGVSETSIGKWREQFLTAGRQGLGGPPDRSGSPAGRGDRRPDPCAGRGACRAACAQARRASWDGVSLSSRVEHTLPVSRFCEIVGLPVRTYYDRRARHHAGRPTRGPWPTPARDVQARRRRRVRRDVPARPARQRPGAAHRLRSRAPRPRQGRAARHS
jgi:hypothetical protein